jgi:hypothetical protein
MSDYLIDNLDLKGVRNVLNETNMRRPHNYSTETITFKGVRMTVTGYAEESEFEVDVISLDDDTQLHDLLADITENPMSEIARLAAEAHQESVQSIGDDDNYEANHLDD